MILKRLWALLLVSVLLFSSLTFTACGENSFKRAAEAVKDLNSITLRAVRATDQAFDKKLISLQTKDKLADALFLIAASGKQGVVLLRALREQYGENLREIPRAKWLEFTRLFDDGVVKPFLDVLQLLNALSPEQSSEIRIAIAAIRSAVLIIAGAFNQRASLEKRFSDVQSQSYGGMAVNTRLLQLSVT